MNRQRFINAIRKRLPLRLHMTLILTATGFAGVGISKLLLVSGLDNVLIRYPLMVACAYLVFFAIMKLWLFLISERPASSSVVDSVSDVTPDIPLPSFDGGGGVSSSFAGGGGEFSGGGASGSFDVGDAVGSVAKNVGETVGDTVGDAVGGIVDDEGGFAIAVVVGALMVLLLSVFGIGIYLVYQAPVILSEAAFNAVLAAGLARSSRMINQPDWMGSVFRATGKPFATILAVSAVAGWAMHHYLPRAERIADVYRLLVK